MEPHIHSGFVVFATVGVYAVLFIQLIRLLASWLVTHSATERLGQALGATVHFG